MLHHYVLSLCFPAVLLHFPMEVYFLVASKSAHYWPLTSVNGGNLLDVLFLFHAELEYAWLRLELRSVK